MPTRASTDRPLTVAGLTRRIGDAMADLGTVVVQGELIEATVARSGHLYASLGDGECSLRVVMWRSAVMRQSVLPQAGMQVLVRGVVEVYGPRGTYQLIASSIRPVGAGDLAARFEEMKRRLQEEGLFAEDRKVELPFLPRAIGLVTAPGSAALADLLHSIWARFPGMPVLLAASSVQGPTAVDEIAHGIASLDNCGRVDVIIVGRGGGSLEDLWAFNEEAVVRAIAHCRTPIISAVGHETDTTLADYAADCRAKTPTAAGEMVVPLRSDLVERLQELHLDLDRAMEELLQQHELHLRHLLLHRALAGPQQLVQQHLQRLDEIELRLDRALDQRLGQQRRLLQQLARSLRRRRPRAVMEHYQRQLLDAQDRLERSLHLPLERLQWRWQDAAHRLEALSPLKVLARGYAIAQTAEGVVIRRRNEVQTGQTLHLRLIDSMVETKVEGVRPLPAAGQKSQES